MYASYIKRTLSYATDLVLGSILYGVGLISLLPITDDFYLVQILNLIINTIWIIFNYMFLPSTCWQATVGQKIFGIKTVDICGNTLSFWRACYRHCIFMFCFWGAFMYFFSPKKQCLHDFLCDSLVVENSFPMTQYRVLRSIRYSIIIIALLFGLIIPLLLNLRAML